MTPDLFLVFVWIDSTKFVSLSASGISFFIVTVIVGQFLEKGYQFVTNRYVICICKGGWVIYPCLVTPQAPHHAYDILGCGKTCSLVLKFLYHLSITFSMVLLSRVSFHTGSIRSLYEVPWSFTDWRRTFFWFTIERLLHLS